MNGHGNAVATEHEFEATCRRLVAHPEALNAVLQTARALRRFWGPLDFVAKSDGW